MITENNIHVDLIWIIFYVIHKKLPVTQYKSIFGHLILYFWA